MVQHVQLYTNVLIGWSGTWLLVWILICFVFIHIITDNDNFMDDVEDVYDYDIDVYDVYDD